MAQDKAAPLAPKGIDPEFGGAPGGVGFPAAASEVFPKAIRFMMSEGGNAGSEA